MYDNPSANQWSTLDRWWTTYVETESPVLTPPTTVAIDPRCMAGIHEEIDAWWESYVDIGMVWKQAQGAEIDRSIDPNWTDLEPWWDSYLEARAEDVAELDSAFSESNSVWERQDGPFDADPLSSEWGDEMRSGDPLNPGDEEAWSDWLAQLLRRDSGEFHRELFGEEIATASGWVEREAHFPNPNDKDRYADILSVHGSGGISIEVKIGDKNFGKTIDTIELIEDQRYGKWHHYLLVPEDDLWAVRESFDEEVSIGDEDRPIIPSEEYEDIELLYWSDVSRALRAVLLDESAQDAHWTASAYLFCTQIERKRLGFTPEPVVKQLGTEGSRVRSLESVSIVIDDLETQVEYLTAFTEDTNE